jgi:hypothetical protein
MAGELTAWMAMLALDGPARAWEPKRLRLRLFSAAGRIVAGCRRRRLRLAHDLALGHPDHHRDQPPANPRTRLTSPHRPCQHKGDPRACGTPPTRRDSRASP